MAVSIPFRYAENEGAKAEAYLIAEFQFLLGTLKTPSMSMGDLQVFWFQFLLGTLKTPSTHSS